MYVQIGNAVDDYLQVVTVNSKGYVFWLGRYYLCINASYSDIEISILCMFIMIFPSSL